MGEWSKSIGEKGEKIVDEFLGMLGWKSTLINESLKCIYSEKHKNDRTKKGKSTHGADSTYFYESPFFTGELNHIIISSKFSNEQYPKSKDNKGLNSIFEKHFLDLSYTVECYQRSNLKIDNSKMLRDIEREKTYGILFWLSNSIEDLEYSAVSKLTYTPDKTLVYDVNYIIDNERASFLYNSIKNIISNYEGYDRQFYYIDTGSNPSSSSKRYIGKELPIQLMISDILLFRLKKDNEKILVMIVKDDFSEESLNRILGLAHNLTKGLTKINIHFPNYDTLKNSTIVSQVKRGFNRSSEVVDSINILAYNENITELGNDNKTNELVNNDEEIIKLEHNQILPYGNELRDMLSRSSITAVEMNKLLRKKGVYLSKPDKENILPILSSILLSPSEFDFLKNKQKTREDSEKIRSDIPIQCIDTIKNENLITILPPSINLNEIAQNQYSTYKFHNIDLSFEMMDDNPNRIKASFTITKYENNKIWFENKNEFYGYVIFELNKDKLEIKTSSIHTSLDTENIIDLIKKEVLKILKNKNLIDNNTQEKKILLNDFLNNNTSIPFFLKFTTTGLNELIFENIISMELELNKDEPLPKDSDIKWMENKIQKFKLDGKEIQEVELINNDKNYKYLQCWGMVAKYSFNSKEGIGECNINFSFQKKGKNEFELHIGKIDLEEIITTKKSAENFILETLDNLKLDYYQKTMEDKNV
ncbi:MAG: hypothetical protein U9P72_12315 [Campylobacterota bacterium]|nr:hypothetical protein [Campylobacterota bacterium]